MRTRNFSNELVLVAIVGFCSWGCQVTSKGDGSGGSPSGGAGGGAGGDTGGTGGTSSSKTFDPTKLPCDTYADDGGPCVAAHSTVRQLRSAYSGPLYQLRKGGSNTGTGGTTHEIAIVNGFADGADQDSFCGTDACTISIIYDQSGKGNDLTVAPPGGQKTTGDNEANAKSLPVTISGHNVYGEHNPVGVGYRNNAAVGTQTGDGPQTVYMVTNGTTTGPTNGTYSNGGCCFDYGNAEKNSRDNGEGTMEAVYFGTCTIWGKGADNGPWIMGDLENGLWAGDVSPYLNNKPITNKYITGLVKGDTKSAAWANGHWAIKSADAQSGGLTLVFDGKRPSSAYNPMRLEGAIILGTGGDNSNSGQGNFFEGLMTTHYSSDAADDAVQANIVSVYGN